jgi:hypothetical protein
MTSNNPSTREDVINIARTMVKNPESYTYSELVTAYYEQVAANCGYSIELYMLDRQIPANCEEEARQGFKNFSDGMQGII